MAKTMGVVAGAIYVAALLAWLVYSVTAHRDGNLAVPCAIIAVVIASPILIGWWWADAAKRRREAREEAELTLTLAKPIYFVLHELAITLPADAARALAAEMDRGTTLAHRTAETLGSAALAATVRHSSVSYADVPALREAFEQRAREAPDRGYRGGSAPRDDAGEGALREVVWSLGVAYVELPAHKPESSEDVGDWLDGLVPVVPERTLVSEVRVRTPGREA